MAASTNKLTTMPVLISRKTKNQVMSFDLEDKCKTIISIIGEKKVQELYHHFRSERISFALLHKYLKKKEITNQLEGDHTIKSIAKHYKVSRMTIYRLIHEKLNS